MKKDIERYLTKAQEHGVVPNFFMSEAYLELSNAQIKENSQYIWIKEGKWCLFPPLPKDRNVIAGVYPVKKIWANFISGFSIYADAMYFLDWNYIFRPSDFLDMSGGHWETFRKNCRKWPKRNPGWSYSDKIPTTDQAQKLLLDWLEEKSDTVEDAELLVWFAYYASDLPIYRKFLYNSKGDLVAINAWDENWTFLNYRVCIVDHSEPYLDEFIRWCFYTDPQIIEANKLVNDGGTLGNVGLERFKDKMNPFEKHKIYSWILK